MTLRIAVLVTFDHYYVPEANRRQDALRNEIKNRPVQTYLRPDRKWIFGRGRAFTTTSISIPTTT
jgi:hypothetical protein